MEAYSGDEYRLASSAFSHEATGHDPVEGQARQRLEVFVIYTDAPGTQAALRMADELARKLEAHLELLIPYEVPYTLPLSKPAVPVGFLEGQIRNLVCKTGLEVAAHIYLCRDRRCALEILLRPCSLVAVGGKKRWWPTPAQKLARDLQRKGHHVIFAELR